MNFPTPTGARRLTVPIVVATTALVALAGPAWAHVSVNPSTAETGGFTQLAFRVPNESASAATTGLKVTFPAGSPLAFVSVRPTPGWTAKVDKATLQTPITSDDGDVTDAVSSITWTGGSIRPGEYQDFDVSVGPLPERATDLTFKAVQTYSDGEVVRWIDVAQPGGAEPEHPAPVLKVVAAGPADGGVAAQPAASAASGSTSADTSDTTGRVLGGAGLLAGLAALGIVLAGRRRGRAGDVRTQGGAAKQTTRV